MLVRSTFLAFIVAGFMSATAVSGQTVLPSPASHELKGIVIDVSKIPIARAEIIVASGPTVLRQTLTASDGTFNLGALPLGGLSLKIRQLGYEPKTGELQIGPEQPAPLDITLTATATELKKVVINVIEVSALDEFNQHRKQNRGSPSFTIRKRFEGEGPCIRAISSARSPE